MKIGPQVFSGIVGRFSLKSVKNDLSGFGPCAGAGVCLTPRACNGGGAAGKGFVVGIPPSTTRKPTQRLASPGK